MIEKVSADTRIGKVTWKDYGTYPRYPQLHEPFVPDVSIVDVLMCCGDSAPRYLWGYREAAGARVSPV